MNIENAIINLMDKLSEAEISAAESGWLSNDDVKSALGYSDKTDNR